MSPTPGRSTLITSAPNQARSCVQVGPDCTWVKSRMRTPLSACVIIYSRRYLFAASADERLAGSSDPAVSRLFLLAEHALRIEVADAAALAAGSRIDHRIDEGRLAAIHRFVHGALELVRRGGVYADAAEGLHHHVVARALDEDGGGDVRATGRIDVGAAIDAVIVEDDDADRQIVAADGLDLHAGKAEGTVALDGEHRLAGFDGGGDRGAHADAHHAPGADVEPLARLVHVDHAAREVERVGAFVDEDGVGPFL